MSRDREQEAFEDNKVYLWGVTKADSELLKQYDKGNKNPFSVVHKKKAHIDTRIKAKEAKTGKFNKDTEYDISDMDFLNSERERILEEQEEVEYGSEEDEQLQQDLDAVEAEIARLEKVKFEAEEAEWNKPKEENQETEKKYKEIDQATKRYQERREAIIKKFKANIRGLDTESAEYEEYDEEKDKATEKLLKEHEAEKAEIMKKYENKPPKKESKKKGKGMTEETPIMQYIHIGQGFKAGSPEAKVHAERMRLAREAKKAPKEPEPEKPKSKRGNASKKGSEEMKARMAELNRMRSEKAKAKKEVETKQKEEKRESKLKPWFYIGDIPKGYREATMDEAILKNMVSPYGKYQVDYNLWFFWDKYHININKKQSDSSLLVGLSASKIQIQRVDEKIKTVLLQLENPKYYDEQNVLEAELEDLKEDHRVLEVGYNKLKKIYDARKGNEFTYFKFNLPSLEYKKAEKPKELPKQEEKRKWGKREIQKLTTKFSKLDLELRKELQHRFLDNNDYEGLEQYLNDLENEKQRKKEQKKEDIRNEVPEVKGIEILKVEYFNGEINVIVSPKLNKSSDETIENLKNEILEALKKTRGHTPVKKEKKNKSLYKKEPEPVKEEPKPVKKESKPEKIMEMTSTYIEPLSDSESEDEKPKKNKAKKESEETKEEKINWTQEMIDELLEESEKYEDKMTPSDQTLYMKYTMADDWDALDKLISKYKKSGSGLVQRKPDTSKESIVQSVVFEKDKWTVDKAKKWLTQNNFYNDDIDIKPTQIRFRQFNPDDLKNYHYISKPIKDKHILLIIAEMRMRPHLKSGRGAGEGDLIHIDIASHNLQDKEEEVYPDSDEGETGGGLKKKSKRRGRPKKVKETSGISRTPNSSLEQMLKATREKQDEKARKIQHKILNTVDKALTTRGTPLREGLIALTTSGAGLGKRPPKGSPEMKEYMAKLRGLKKK